jgi:hypothetical protein
MLAIQGHVKKNLCSHEKEKKSLRSGIVNVLFLTKQMTDTEKKHPDVLPLSLSLSSNSIILCEHARASEKKHSESKRREREREREKNASTMHVVQFLHVNFH